MQFIRNPCRRSTIAGLPSIFCMSLMGQIQTWFMGQATTGLKEEVTTLESLKSSLQTFFTRDNYSEVSHCNRFTLTIASGFLCPKCRSSFL